MKLPRILTLFVAAVACHVQAQPMADDLIVEMNRAFQQGNQSKLSQLLPQVRGHALEPWAAYWELKTRLDTALPPEVQDFFTRYAGTYQEDRLRNDWLLLLGQRRDWTNFDAEYPKFRMKDDREVRCYSILVALTREGAAAPAALADEVRHNWFSLRDVDDGCTLAASRLVGNTEGPRMSPNDAWHKARLAMAASRPDAAAAAVRIVAPEAFAQFTELNNSPTRFLVRRVVAASKVRKEMIALALIKLATGDADNAARQLDGKWGPQLTPEERNWVWGVIARQKAQRLGDDALEHYAKVSRDNDLTDDMLAWKVRAALRAARGPQWAAVLQATNAMSEEARREPAWVYWKARALLAGNPADTRRAEAPRLLESIASPRGFYEQLALEELGRKITVPPRPTPLTAEEKDAVRANPGLNRALQAIALGIRPEGVREWNYTTNVAKPGGMAERELLAAAQLACEREVWDRCINTSERTKTAFDFEQRFPMPFRESVVKRSQEIGLDPAYVYGLIRQESRFIMDARSNVGASGLMQVMPATARWTARKIGLANFAPHQLSDRETNIAIGTGYLKLVLDDFDGSMPLAAAAYNAGPGRPRSWRNGAVIEAAAWAENVPFGETRDYVKKVLANTTIYAAILSGQPQSLKARLGMVGPRDASLPEPNGELP
jgi:soluble lytic murein transglycosylase